MSSVTFSTTVGGDGSTVTDDDDATTGLRNGGWRTRFVPALTQEVAVAANAVASATAALSSKNAAATSASNAATSASNASTSATNAASSATAAADSYDSFDDRYLGAKTSDPTVDNDGNALLTGALYWNSATGVFKVWSGSAWVTNITSNQFGTNVATFLATPSSANLAAALTDKTGTGVAVFASNPTFPAQINLTANSGYNIYASGTADNYLEGKLNIGSGAATGQNFRLAKTLTGATSTYGFVNQATIATDSTATATFNYTGISTAAAASIGSVTGYNITLDSLGAGSSIGTMTGYSTGAFASATNNYGFYGAIAFGTGRYNLHMAGTADNYLEGNLGIGTASPGYKLTVAGLAAFGPASGVYGNNADMRLETATGYGWRMGTTSTGSTHGYFYIQGSTDNFVSSFITGLNIDTSGNVGIGTASPDASAILDAQSTTKGVRMPNMTTTQKNAIASPAAGLMVFDTTLSKLCVYSGAAWQTITSI